MTKNDDQRYGFELVENWGDSADGWSFVEVADVCVDLRDNVFALGRGESAVQVFSPSGERTARWGQGRFIRSHSIELSPDASALFCIDCDGHTVTKFTLDGEPIFTIDSEAEPGYTGYVKDIVSSVQRAGPPFCYPTSISFGPDGDLFVTDGYGNARVHQFDSGGSLKSSWGEPGNGAGQFRLPHGILVDEEVLFVADRENDRVQVFNLAGEVVGQWNDCYRPAALCKDKISGAIFLAELGRILQSDGSSRELDFTKPAGRVTVRNSSGQILSEISSDGAPARDDYFAPHGIAIDSSGNLYVAEVSVTYFQGAAPPDHVKLRKLRRL